MVSMEITCIVSINQPSDGLWQYKSSTLMLLRPFSLIMNRPVDIMNRPVYIMDIPVYIIYRAAYIMDRPVYNRTI